jgi:hypothetical protein
MTDADTAEDGDYHTAKRGRDWMVREDGGRELGHYSTRKEAEAVGGKLAHKRGVDLVVQDASGKSSSKRRNWLSRLLRRLKHP